MSYLYNNDIVNEFSYKHTYVLNNKNIKNNI